MSDGFYRAFEEKHRGTRELIISRLQAYLPFVEPLSKSDQGSPTIDLGCGRGEWLELMAKIGFKPYGVDLDEGMLKACIERRLPAEQGDAVAFLAKLPSESQSIVSAFHVVEHIKFEQLRTVVSEALRVLKPGGLLIMETPNPENIIVSTLNFYLDPTHQHPIPPQLLSFLPEYYGFARIKTLRLQESKDLIKSEFLTLNNVLQGVSPDYAVIAQKFADDTSFKALDAAFSQEYGLSFEKLVSHYQWQSEANAQQFESWARDIEGKTQEAFAKAQQAESLAEGMKAIVQDALTKARRAETLAEVSESKAQESLSKAQQAETRAGFAEAAHTAISNSRSWRITAPFRRASNVLRRFLRGSIVWLAFAPGSWPRLTLRSVLITMKSRISSVPLLKTLAARTLSFFPKLDARLRLVGNPCPTKHSHIFGYGIEGIENLSPRARKIYFDLKDAIEQRQREQR